MNRHPQVFTILVFTAMLALASCSGGRAGAERAVREYVAAIKAGDQARLKAVTTESLYEQMQGPMQALNVAEGLLGGMGLAKPSEMFENAKLKRVATDKIEGDTAYVDAEFEISERQVFQRIVVKKVDGRWRVAGMQ